MYLANKRIDIITKSNKSYLTEFWDYTEKTQSLLSEDDFSPKSISDNQESVYKFFKDPKIVDITLPEFQQIHLIRFEKVIKSIIFLDWI